MELIKNTRKCGTCVFYRTCEHTQNHVFSENDICSNWQNRKGITYNDYYDTLRYKWIRYRTRHYGHPIRDILIMIIPIIIGIILLIGTILECIHF